MSPPPAAIDGTQPLALLQRQLAAVFLGGGSGLTVAEAMSEARILICAALDIDHAGFLRDADKPIGAFGEVALARLDGFVVRRRRHEPVSRILGRREFFGLDLAISPAVLDPRPDTETIVEAAIDTLDARRDAPLRLLDLGTGSGALLCALLTHFQKAVGLGLDISEAACRIAQQNLAALGLILRGKIVCDDWSRVLGSFDLIVANPPYIARAEIERLAPDVRDFDPHVALDGGPDGYDAYRAISLVLPKLLARGGIAIFEVGQGQAHQVAHIYANAGLRCVGMRRDLAGIERAVIVRHD